MKIEFSGHSYELRDELTGRDYLDLRRAGVSLDGTVDMASYGHLNLVRRLASWDWDKELSEEGILNLPLAHYQVLYNSAMRMETDESRAAQDFLLGIWSSSKQGALPSTSGQSSKRHRDGAESLSSEAASG